MDNMTEQELDLINLIRTHSNPADAMRIALEIITANLTPRGSSESPSPDAPRESA